MPKPRAAADRTPRSSRRALLTLAAGGVAAGGAAAYLYLRDTDTGGQGASDTGSDQGFFGGGSEQQLALNENDRAETLAADLADQVEAHLSDTGTSADVSVAAAYGGLQIACNEDYRHDTASIVKAELLVMALRHYGDPDAIPSDVQDRIHAMITESDNDATTSIYDSLGGEDALAQACADLGMDATEPQEDAWGLTETTVTDQLTLLDHALFEGVLDADQVDYARDLMSSVVDWQAWGVSAAAEDGETVWLKNGWDTRSALGGLWVVNSIGVLAGDTDDPLALTVLTSGTGSQEEGVDLVESLAAIARGVITGS